MYYNEEIMIEDFAKLLKELLNTIIAGLTSTKDDWNQKSYEAVVKCLLFKDEIAVKEAVDHLLLEGKELAIPPLYLASQKHPRLSVRSYCLENLKKLDRYDKIDSLVRGRDINSALESLIEEYGHFKKDYY